MARSLVSEETGLFSLKAMKKVYIFLLLVASSLSGSAQTDGSYYRVRNANTERYISIIDNRGEISVEQNKADFGALKTLVDGYSVSVVSAPSTVIHFRTVAGGWDLESQGVGTYSIIRYPVQVGTHNGYKTAYASASGLVAYLADATVNSAFGSLKDGSVVQRGPKDSWDYSHWELLPVLPTEDSYFGLTPTVSCGGKYYQTFFASFPFTLYSQGMNAYYVHQVDEEKAAVVITELTDGVPAATPVIVKCSSNQATDNRLDVGKGSGTVSNNQLTGVYFCNDVPEAPVFNHRNVVDYNAETMRVLGTAADGSLAFVKSSTLQYVPTNTAYITVSANAPDELKVYTQAEYDQLTPAVVEGDLSGDGEVTVTDQVIMGNIILGLRPYSAEADLNGDGIVNVTDYVALGNIILGKEN